LEHENKRPKSKNHVTSYFPRVKPWTKNRLIFYLRIRSVFTELGILKY
jgi:hypothetical protein